MRYRVIAFSMIIVLGCVPYSDNPLTDPGQRQIDSSILGTWFWQDEKESGYIHIGLDDKSKLLRLVMLEFERDGEIEVFEFCGHTSALGGNRYLNLRWVRPARNETASYMFIKYAVKAGSLGIALMDYSAAKTAIQKGSLKGRVEKDNGSSSVRITEGQQKLREFILREDSKLFPEMKYVMKLKLPKRSER